MGFYDRHYQRGASANPYPFGATGISGWSVNTWIIVINAAIFVLDVLLLPFFPHQHPLRGVAIGPLTYWGYFSTTEALGHLQIWRFVTFQFLHAGILHILFNMLGLYWFGPQVEQYLGSRRYLVYYLLCGCAGAAMYLVLNVGGIMLAQSTGQSFPLLLPNHPGEMLVGASAGVFGVIFAVAYLRPDQIVTLFLFFILPISMRIKTLAYGLLVIAFLTLYTGGFNAGGEAGHIGGALFGAWLIRHPRWLNWANFMPGDGLKRRGHHAFRRFQGTWGSGAAPDRFEAPRPKPGYFERRRQARATSDEAEVDRILAKVGTQGLHSLTEREKQVLQRDTERRRQGLG